MSSDEEAEFLGEEEDDDDDEMEVESETPEEEDSEEEESKSRRKSARNKGASRKKSTKMTTRQLRQSYISALASVPSEAVIAATAAAAAVPTTTSPVRRPRGRANPTSLTSLSLIDQAYEYSSDIFTDYLERRSLFKDSQWFLSQPSCSQGSVKNLKKWAGDFGSSINFPSTDLLITRQQKGQGQGQAGLEKQLRLSPYQCRSTAEQDHNEGGDHCESDENGIGSSRKPMPKKKRGKKARQDQSNEAYQVIMQIYKRNQWYLHAGGTVNTVQFSSSYSMNRQDNTCTHYLAVGTSCINWYGEMNEALAAAGLGVGYDHPHEVADSGSPFSQTPNLLQIYSVIISLNDPIDQDPDSDPDPAVGVAADAVSPTILSVKLAYCVGFQACGPIWDVKWCPEDNFRSLEAEDSVLGTVAIVSADGKCRVLVLPTPQSLRVSANADAAPPNIAIPEAIRDVPIISETDLCRWELSSVSECVLSVAWGGGNGGKGQDGVSPLLLACGLSTGSIALWDLSLPTLQHSVAAAKHSSSNGAGSSPHDPKLVVSYLPLSKFVDMTVRVGNTATSNARAVACGVRVISFCPYDGDLLASGGYDGTLKVWHLRDRFRPVYTRDQSAPWLYALEWNRHGCGIMWASAGNPTVFYDQLWIHEQQQTSRFVTHSHPSLYSGVNRLLHLPDSPTAFCNLCCSIASDGSLVGSSYPLIKKGKKKVDAIHFYRIHEVTMQEEISSATGEVVRYAEVVVNDKIKEAKPDLSTRISPPPVALLGLHATDLAGNLSDRSSVSPLPSRLSAFHLVAYGGQAGLVRLHLLHSSCFHPRIQLFQDT